MKEIFMTIFLIVSVLALCLVFTWGGPGELLEGPATKVARLHSEFIAEHCTLLEHKPAWFHKDRKYQCDDGAIRWD